MTVTQAIFAMVALALTLAGVLWVLAPVRHARTMSAATAAAVPLLAVALYFTLGSPKALDATGRSPPHAQGPADLGSMVSQLQARLERQPADLEGWFMLARSYQVLEQWDLSAAAYRRAVALAPKDADLLADLADVVAAGAQGELEGEPRSLLERALEADPSHAKTRLLLASAEFKQGRFAQAQAHWDAVVRTAPADSKASAVARQALAQLQGTTPNALPAASAVKP